MLATLAFAIIALSMALSCLYAGMIVWSRLGARTGDKESAHYPKVSIFLTLRNRDDGLEENLTSVFSLDYPDYDIYLAVDGMEDPCMGALERVRSRFAGVRSYIVAARHSAAGNPKVNKLALMERRSEAPLVWVLDADVRVAPGTLKALVGEHLRSGARIVFSPIRCQGARSFGSLIEMSYVNFYLSGSVVTAWKILGRRVVVGKSLLIERKALEQVGGFTRYSDLLAEDHWLGETFFRSGFPVRCSAIWIDTVKETSTVGKFFARMNRWAKLRYHLNRGIYLLEILLDPLALVLIFSPLLKMAVPPLAAAVVALRLIQEYLVFFSVNSSDRRRLPVILALAPAVIIKDLLQLVVFFTPFFSGTVSWRGGRIRIGKNTRIIQPDRPRI
jgi:ceramide glucosyltransferase